MFYVVYHLSACGSYVKIDGGRSTAISTGSNYGKYSNCIWWLETDAGYQLTMNVTIERDYNYGRCGDYVMVGLYRCLSSFSPRNIIYFSTIFWAKAKVLINIYKFSICHVIFSSPFKQFLMQFLLSHNSPFSRTLWHWNWVTLILTGGRWFWESVAGWNSFKLWLCAYINRHYHCHSQLAESAIH